MDRFKHYLLGKEFVIATDHKALVSALDENKSNKTYQSRLTRWVDRLLPYQFKVVHLPGKDMGIVDYLSRNPKGEPWPESVLDEKFAVTSIESFHKALDCLNSRLNDQDSIDRNENVLEYSRFDQNVSNKNTSSTRCYSNQNGPKRTKHDRNERNEDSHSFQREKRENPKISISQNRQRIQSVQSLEKTRNFSNHKSRKMHSGELEKSGKEKKMVRIQERNNNTTLREEVTTTFNRTRMIRPHISEDSDLKQIPQARWYLPNTQSGQSTSTAQTVSPGNRGPSTSTVSTAQSKLVSFWELVGSNRSTEPPFAAMELEAISGIQSPKPPGLSTSGDEAEVGQIVEVDLTLDSDDRDYSSGTETCVITPQKTRHNSRKSEYKRGEQLMETENPLSLDKLFDKILLAELVSEDTWMDRLRRVVERNDRHGFELMGIYTNPLWHQMSVVDDCLLVDNRLAVPEKLRQAVLRRLHQGHPGQEAVLEVSNYMWWPHMHKDIVNMAEECRSCTRYGKNAKYLIPKNSAKPLPLLSQPGQELQLDYAGPLEDHKGKKIYLLVAIDRYSKFPSVKVTKSTGGKSTIKFLRTYIDTHGIPESIKTDQFSGFKGKAMKKFCTENNITQKFCPVGDHRGCGLVERTIQTIKKRLGVMLLDKKVQSIKLCLSTIIRDLRWNKQKSIKVSRFEANFGRLPKTEFKIVRDKFLMDSDRLDKEHLERSALTASQLKRRIDQSRENVKIIRKGRNSRDTSPLFRHDMSMTKDRARAKELKQLLEANARWNATRRDLSDSELRRVVDETSTINPELRKELLYSWERGFIEDKQTTSKEDLSGSFLRKHEQRKSGKALTIPLKSKIVSETPSTIKTAAGAVYRKSDIARSKLSTQPKAYSSEKKRSPTGEEPRSKQQKTGTLPVEEDSDSAEEHDAKDRGLRDENLEDSQLKEKFQNSPSVVTSRDTRTGGGLNLGGKRGKPNRAGPVVQNTKTTRGKTQESGTTKAAKTVTKKRDTSNEAVYIESSAPNKAPTTKKIKQQTSEKKILDTFQNNNMTSQEWEEIQIKC